MTKPAAVAVLAVVSLAACSSLDDSIDYRGERIKLSRRYFDYDDYKNDPNNIHPSEVARVQRLVRSAPPGPEFGSWEEVVRGASAITFPGYGFGSARSATESFRAASIEVPQAEQERVIVFHAEDGGWRRIDDFLATGPPSRIVEDGGALTFLDYGGRRLAVRPLRVK